VIKQTQEKFSLDIKIPKVI